MNWLKITRELQPSCSHQTSTAPRQSTSVLLPLGRLPSLLHCQDQFHIVHVDFTTNPHCPVWDTKPQPHNPRLSRSLCLFVVCGILLKIASLFFFSFFFFKVLTEFSCFLGVTSGSVDVYCPWLMHNMEQTPKMIIRFVSGVNDTTWDDSGVNQASKRFVQYEEKINLVPKAERCDSACEKLPYKSRACPDSRGRSGLWRRKGNAKFKIRNKNMEHLSYPC